MLLTAAHDCAIKRLSKFAPTVGRFFAVAIYDGILFTEPLGVIKTM